MKDNIKCYFATCENLPQFIGAKTGGVDYGLLSAYPLIGEKLGFKPHLAGSTELNGVEKLQLVANNCKKTILDSGVFTLTFGAQAGLRNFDFMYKWQEFYIKLIQDANYLDFCVEVDCQKILGVQQAWDFRVKLKEALPNNVIINVIHLEDGVYGLDKMIEFSDYIGISVPEYKSMGKGNKIVPLVNYIKKRKPDIKIHLLGTTAKIIIEPLKDIATSCDSSSWMFCVRNGYIANCHISTLNENTGSFLKNKYDAICNDFNLQLPLKIPNNRKILFTLGAMEKIQTVTKLVGKQ